MGAFAVPRRRRSKGSGPPVRHLSAMKSYHRAKKRPQGLLPLIESRTDRPALPARAQNSDFLDLCCRRHVRDNLKSLDTLHPFPRKAARSLDNSAETRAFGHAAVRWTTAAAVMWQPYVDHGGHAQHATHGAVMIDPSESGAVQAQQARKYMHGGSGTRIAEYRGIFQLTCHDSNRGCDLSAPRQQNAPTGRGRNGARSVRRGWTERLHGLVRPP